jgi:drug/metabolite transporter superfamily protein YnfA
MTPALKASARYWIAGTALAFAGVAVARVVAPGYEARTRAALALTGQLVALAGLAIILLGIRRRLSRTPSPATEI